MLALKIVPEHLSRPDTRNVLDFGLRQTRKKSTSLMPRPVANVGTVLVNGTEEMPSSQNGGRAKIVAHTFRERRIPRASHAVDRDHIKRIPVRAAQIVAPGVSPDTLEMLN